MYLSSCSASHFFRRPPRLPLPVPPPPPQQQQQRSSSSLLLPSRLLPSLFFSLFFVSSVFCVPLRVLLLRLSSGSFAPCPPSLLLRPTLSLFPLLLPLVFRSFFLLSLLRPLIPYRPLLSFILCSPLSSLSLLLSVVTAATTHIEQQPQQQQQQQRQQHPQREGQQERQQARQQKHYQHPQQQQEQQQRLQRRLAEQEEQQGKGARNGSSKMSGLRRMTAVDLFHFNAVNLDVFTETFVQHFYHRYLTNWPELCLVVEAFDGAIAGYIIGKVEGKGADWHGHVTAFSVAPEYRHSGVAQQLMRHFEETCEKVFFCFYIDLFVRVSNAVAVNFYRKLGYRVWKTEKGYYSGEEDALDMRKPLPRDINCLCMEFAEEKLLPEPAAASASRGTDEITGSNDKTPTPTTEKSSSSSSSENINSSGKNNNSSKSDNEKINSSGQSSDSGKSDSDKINSSSER